MIAAFLGALVRVAVHAIPTLLGFGTLMGTDRLMKYASHERVGPWVITGMNALQRTHLIDVANEILKQDASPERSFQFMHNQMQIIATCARSPLGYILFDPGNPKHLDKLSRYPEELLQNAFIAACRLSGLEYLTPSTDAKPEKPPELNLVTAETEEDDGLDWPEDNEKVSPNP